jgi:hypothetical protein
MYRRENLAYYHFEKIERNRIRMENAQMKAEQLVLEKYEKDKANIRKWEDYREKKIELTARFIKVLKRKNFLKRWLILGRQGIIYAKARDNLYIRRELDRVKFASIFVAIRFKVAYMKKYRKRFGEGQKFILEDNTKDAYQKWTKLAKLDIS